MRREGEDRIESAVDYGIAPLPATLKRLVRRGLITETEPGLLALPHQ